MQGDPEASGYLGTAQHDLWAGAVLNFGRLSRSVKGGERLEEDANQIGKVAHCGARVACLQCSQQL